MIIFPSAVVFVNNDLTQSLLDKIITQLFITDIIDGYTFDGYIASNPDYLISTKSQNRRVLVIRAFNDLTNRNLADVAIFIKNIRVL